MMKLSIAAVYLLFGFGILWHSIPATLPYVLLLTPFVLLITYVIILTPEFRKRNFRSLIWLAAIYIVTFIIEAAGVHTGLIFGNYTYGDILGIKLFEVPLIIGLNWGMIIWGAAELAGLLKSPLLIKIITASAAAVILDILIEPAAMTLDYWNWSNSIIPFRNYAAWFIISAVFSTSYFLLKLKSDSSLPVHFYISQLLFFGLINIIMA